MLENILKFKFVFVNRFKVKICLLSCMFHYLSHWCVTSIKNVICCSKWIKGYLLRIFEIFNARFMAGICGMGLRSFKCCLMFKCPKSDVVYPIKFYISFSVMPWTQKLAFTHPVGHVKAKGWNNIWKFITCAQKYIGLSIDGNILNKAVKGLKQRTFFWTEINVLMQN